MGKTDLNIALKTEVLLEALPYFQQFHGSTFVVKIGGSFLEAPGALERVATDLVFLASVGIKVVVVHGGGKAISRAMEAAAIDPVFKNGLRVTDAKTVSIVEKTLNGTINLGVVEKMQAAKGRPVGVYGQQVLTCEKLTQDSQGNPVDIGFVGEVTRIYREKIQSLLDQGYTPVISPVAMDAAEQLYNVNADVAASHIAGGLLARRLVFLCDVPGLLSDPKNPETLISTLRVGDVDRLVETGVIGTGMMPKVESAINALQKGVHRVHFIDGRVPHSLLLEIFTDKGIGTEIVN